MKPETHGSVGPHWLSVAVSRVPDVSTPSRYRCTSCGNLTRFDVTATRRTRSYHHYTVGGELTVEHVDVLGETVELVECRWCGSAGRVEAVVGDELPGAEVTPPPTES